MSSERFSPPVPVRYPHPLTQKAYTPAGILATVLPVCEKNGAFYADVLPDAEIDISQLCFPA